MKVNAKVHLPKLPPPNPERWWAAHPPRHRVKPLRMDPAGPGKLRRWAFWAACIEARLAEGDYGWAPHTSGQLLGYSVNDVRWAKHLNSEVEPVRKTAYRWIHDNWDALGGSEDAWRRRYRSRDAIPGSVGTPVFAENPERPFGMKAVWQDALMAADPQTCGILLLLPSGQFLLCDELLLDPGRGLRCGREVREIVRAGRIPT